MLIFTDVNYQLEIIDMGLLVKLSWSRF